MRILIMTPHLALTYPNHCPTSCRTNSHFVPINVRRHTIMNQSSAPAFRARGTRFVYLFGLSLCTNIFFDQLRMRLYGGAYNPVKP